MIRIQPDSDGGEWRVNVDKLVYYPPPRSTNNTGGSTNNTGCDNYVIFEVCASLEAASCKKGSVWVPCIPGGEAPLTTIGPPTAAPELPGRLFFGGLELIAAGGVTSFIGACTCVL
jgi:hypothetical protein